MLLSAAASKPSAPASTMDVLAAARWYIVDKALARYFAASPFRSGQLVAPFARWPGRTVLPGRGESDLIQFTRSIGTTFNPVA